MNIQDNVKQYYGKTLSSSDDLKTDACCTIEETPAYLNALLKNVHPKVRARYYGCGLVAPLALEGRRILDLGSGSGQDAFVLSQLAGAKGRVVGVDMTPEQLAIAREHQPWHAEKFGFDNVAFLEGDIERLEALTLEPESFDVIISNCVINLVENKEAVLSAARRLLKTGGEFYFADVYADRRLPESVREDPAACGECLGGALYWNDFLSVAANAGFLDPRLVTSRPLSVSNEDLKAKVGAARFYSATYRLFKIDGLETNCEDYGQAVIYKGGVEQSEASFTLDNHHVMEKGRVFAVCGNTYLMLQQSRFAPHFELLGDTGIHYGIFPGCGLACPFDESSAQQADSSGCC